MLFLNISLLKNDTDEREESEKFLTDAKKINTFITICIIIIGLIGNCLTVIIYGQKKNRKNSSNIYLLCLAINDTLFLFVHFYEDTVRNLKSNFDFKPEIIQFINKIDIIVQNDLTCKFVNYLRYSFRMISVYLIISLTIQRLLIVYKPLNEKNKRKSTAWKSVTFVVLISFFLNLWTFLFFKLNESEGFIYCDMIKDSILSYFYINILYSLFLIILPIIVIVVLNILIIYKLIKTNKKRKIITNSQSRRTDTSANQIRSNRLERLNYDEIRSEPLHVNKVKTNLIKKKNKPIDSKIVLIFVSLSYIILNLPYFIMW
jgi:hypothetical protein